MSFTEIGEEVSGNIECHRICGWSRPFADFGGQHHHNPFRVLSGDGMRIYSYIDANGLYREGHPKNDPDWERWDDRFVAQEKAKRTRRPQFVGNSTTIPNNKSCQVYASVALPTGEIILISLGAFIAPQEGNVR